MSAQTNVSAALLASAATGAVTMSPIPAAVRGSAAAPSARAKQVAKTTLTLTVAALAAAVMIGVSSSAFAGDRESLYPEGSIFLEPALPSTTTSNGGNFADRSAHRSPLDPLDAPDAGNVWKPSNRDAGNLAVQRWQDYAGQRALAQRTGR